MVVLSPSTLSVCFRVLNVPFLTPYFSTFNPCSSGSTKFSLRLLLKLNRENNHSCRLTALRTHPAGGALCDSGMARQMDYIPVVSVLLPATGQKCLIKACQNNGRLGSPHWGRARIMSAPALSNAW